VTGTWWLWADEGDTPNSQFITLSENMDDKLITGIWNTGNQFSFNATLVGTKGDYGVGTGQLFVGGEPDGVVPITFYITNQQNAMISFGSSENPVFPGGYFQFAKSVCPTSVTRSKPRKLSGKNVVSAHP